MDQVEEKEGNRFQEPASDRCEDNEDKEQDNSEESSSVDQRKEEEEEEKEGCEEATPAAAAAAAAPSFFAHPCSLLQYIARVCACCLGLSDSFCDPKASSVLVPEPEPAAADPSQEGEEDMKSSYFYMQEATTRVRAARLRPKPPGNPREGSGGNGGHHH
ncbi:hypothetical protein EE612_025823 [Oryza sativa]|jgi:hypothetical protein|uniref:Uncharacterized protein n=3 Tax=Oryza TaxID=4527 RepID=A0A0D3G055_9ORYZ|nr:uncharacterized protein LOC127769949 isoform X1 [Oryza glaberrima]EEC78101.1 hypothetical protein OsI_17602 [Oryza sativa Indica Group]KAB8097156.1 hypothetical protein EE612_025823 [Oryza sativa]